MGRPRSELLSSLGKLFAIFKTVADKVLELGGSDEDIALITNEHSILADNIALLIALRSKAIGAGPLAIRNPSTGHYIQVGDLVTVTAPPPFNGKPGIVHVIIPGQDRPLYVAVPWQDEKGLCLHYSQFRLEEVRT
jgi:hypothetical protein